MTQQPIAARLAQTWFGAQLSTRAVTELAGAAELRAYPAGATILREGGETEELIVVLSGRVALRTLVPERGPVTILTVEPGDVVGWSALVAPHRSTSTAIAVEPVEAVVLRAVELRASLAADPELAAAVYPGLLDALGRRLVATRTQLLDLYAGQDAVPW
jgi:CRP/FNR family cyclic AMP-dependent transcriptional regulator